MLVVLAILAVLGALLFPVVAQARLSSWRAIGTQQLHQVGLAQLLYQAEDGEFATNRDSLSNWHAQLRPYLPNVASLHPPLFADPRRVSGSNGYAVNSCVMSLRKREHDPQRLVLLSEYALLKTRDGEAVGEIGVFTKPVPDAGAVADSRHQFERSDIWLEGVAASTKFHGVGLYLLLDGHLTAAAPRAVDYHPGFPYACEPSPEDPSTPPGHLTYRLSRN